MIESIKKRAYEIENELGKKLKKFVILYLIIQN